MSFNFALLTVILFLESKRSPHVGVRIGKVCVFAFRGSEVHVFITKCDPICACTRSRRVFQAAIRERFVSEIDSLFIPLRHFSRRAFEFDFALVFRYGDVGKVCAFALRDSGARVLATECDSFCASRAPLRRRWWPWRRSCLRPLCFFQQVTSTSTRS